MRLAALWNEDVETLFSQFLCNHFENCWFHRKCVSFSISTTSNFIAFTPTNFHNDPGIIGAIVRVRVSDPRTWRNAMEKVRVFMKNWGNNWWERWKTLTTYFSSNAIISIHESMEQQTLSVALAHKDFKSLLWRSMFPRAVGKHKTYDTRSVHN